MAPEGASATTNGYGGAFRPPPIPTGNGHADVGPVSGSPTAAAAAAAAANGGGSTTASDPNVVWWEVAWDGGKISAWAVGTVPEATVLRVAAGQGFKAPAAPAGRDAFEGGCGKCRTRWK